jgi:hypothetical protein
MSFSQRKGLTPVRTMLQVGSMDDALRASLWNLLHIHIWDTAEFLYTRMGTHGTIEEFAKALWFQYFKKPFSDIPANPHNILQKVENYYFTCQWNEVYDFLEVVVVVWPVPVLRKAINQILERELAGYRLVNRQFIDVTDPQEIAALEEAINQDQFGPVSTHLSRALELLADRKNPDYRNSIKESISAVESLARIMTKNEKATLGDALKLLERSKALHPALREAFSKLYGYTSDAHGIRHAMLDESNLTAADAKFFLLSCTTFINYLKAQVG